MYVSSGLEVIKLELILKLKIKRNDWLLADTCLQAANLCRLYFEFETVLKFYNLNAWTLKASYTTSHNSSIKVVHGSFVKTYERVFKLSSVTNHNYFLFFTKTERSMWKLCFRN